MDIIDIRTKRHTVQTGNLRGHNAALKLSADLDGLVETSLNLGILKTCGQEVTASTAIRSAVESAKHKVNLQVAPDEMKRCFLPAVRSALTA